MPFEMNEAPDIVLRAIQSARVRRGCGTFWSIVFCLPTLGMSTNCGGSCTKECCCEPACCYPESVDEQTRGSLQTLEEVLMRNVRIDDIRQYRKEHQGETIEAIVEWQVVTTINILRDKLAKEFTTPSDYKNAIQLALTRIEIRARSEASVTVIYNKNPRGGEGTPLLMYELENTNVRTGGYNRTGGDAASAQLNAQNGRKQQRERRDRATASAPATPQAASSSTPTVSPQPPAPAPAVTPKR